MNAIIMPEAHFVQTVQAGDTTGDALKSGNINCAQVAHVCLTFEAYKLYKELERILQEKQSPISARKAIEIAMNIFEITINLPSLNN